MTTIPLRDLVDIVAYCDPAAGKQGTAQVKRTRARSAIVVVGADALARAYVLHTWADRCATDRLVEQIIDINIQFKPRLFGGEADGLQSLFQDLIVREARFRGLTLPLIPIQHSTHRTKEFRIRAAIQAPLRQGRLFTRQDQVELEAELRAFPRGATVDLVDALASAIELLPMRPTATARKADVEAHLAYLRETGAPPEYIQQAAAQLSSAVEPL